MAPFGSLTAILCVRIIREAAITKNDGKHRKLLSLETDGFCLRPLLKKIIQ